ncbi:aminoglycoside phosphotransferase family protein [Dictyobacter kobayashii]|uniref:Aminoglycoside phosphotransferase domain-containing protein n=1 Tax=Dictyobacter kobayashii TaxID=2014872 RepID=A0A402AVD3_9CHLR|nr:aminoglycoside phosphotransferase family protein [Dictyobacter kobayashii]GCE23072.1 hypothetical protein KDK_68720 [Dictyobacter kobayashii]
MNKEISNQELIFAAKRTLGRINQSEETLQSLYLQPDRAIFLAEKEGIILKVYMEEKTLRYEYNIAQKVAVIGVPIPEILGFAAGQPGVLAMKYVKGYPLSSLYPLAAQSAGMYLQRVHNLGAQPPFSGGQQRWDAFISWWSNLEAEKVKRLGVLAHRHIMAFQKYCEALQPLLVQRPVVLLHGDLQPVHILVDPQTEQVLAFLDFADAQPGDPLMDIAVATLWDHELADLLLEGYSRLENNEETKQILSLYRLLRQLGEIPWLLERGFEELADRNITALQTSLQALTQ